MIQYLFYRNEPDGLGLHSGLWFRVFGYGLNIRNTVKLFSERYGYRKSLPLPFGYRVSILKPEKIDKTKPPGKRPKAPPMPEIKE